MNEERGKECLEISMVKNIERRNVGILVRKKAEEGMVRVVKKIKT